MKTPVPTRRELALALAARLQARRRELRMPLRELAASTGVSLATAKGWVSAARPQVPARANRRRLCEVLWPGEAPEQRARELFEAFFF